MGNDAWTVVKVGGSLFDLPDLRDRLRAWLAQHTTVPVLLIPGGGALADVVRTLDQTHRLGEEASHWLAIQAMSLNARFLQKLLPEATFLTEPVALARDSAASLANTSGSEISILDAFPFFQADERHPDHLPHSWPVTSDSLSVRTAALFSARELILLKSKDWPGGDWPEASRSGIVDGYFPAAMCQAPPAMRVRLVNLRRWA